MTYVLSWGFSIPYFAAPVNFFWIRRFCASAGARSWSRFFGKCLAITSIVVFSVSYFAKFAYLCKMLNCQLIVYVLWARVRRRSCIPAVSRSGTAWLHLPPNWWTFAHLDAQPRWALWCLVHFVSAHFSAAAHLCFGRKRCGRLDPNVGIVCVTYKLVIRPCTSASPKS